jgi:hypothetical protein
MAGHESDRAGWPGRPYVRGAGARLVAAFVIEMPAGLELRGAGRMQPGGVDGYRESDRAEIAGDVRTLGDR